jgi:Protein of unknown function (DUF3131)
MSPGLRAARPHLAFLVGLGAALTIMWWVHDPTTSAAPHGPASRDLVHQLALGAPLARRAQQPLTAAELAQAQTAWRYFENNYVAETGLVNAADKYPSATLWDLGSYLMAILAARDLGVIAPEVARDRLDRMLAALARLPLVEGLPNKVYDTRTLAMVDYTNHAAPAGIGWSAIDIARLSVPLTIMVWRDPELAPRVRGLLASWSLDKLVAGGRLQGTVRQPTGVLARVQEGRLGYEQYAAQAMALLGLDVEHAIRWDLEAAIATVSGQPIAYDARLPQDHAGTHNAVVSEPFLLIAFELGLGETSGAITEAVYRAQRRHARETGRLVAVSEDNIDRAPYFVYNSVLNGGVAWAAFTPDGSDASAHRSLSTKAAFGWGHLYRDGYADALVARVAELGDPARGFASGVYDADGKTNTVITANTNGILLEVLWYETRGPVLRAGRE